MFPGGGGGGGMGVPQPDPGIGLGGLPVLPGQDPYDLDRYGKIDDPNDWQLWWAFNRDRFLQFSGINTGDVYSGSDGFYLGKGHEQAKSRTGRADDELIDGLLSDSLKAGMLKGGSYDFCKSSLIAAAKVGGKNASNFAFSTKWYLANGDDDMKAAAAFVTGLIGSDKDYKLLREIALNTEEGCKAITKEGERATPRVPMSVRAFACYGMGMIGSRTSKDSVKRDVVKTLIELLENDASEANDARVAAMIAIGLVPLPVDEDVVACYCGTCVVPDPHTSLRPQVTYLLRYFTASEEFDPILRAHTATTLGRLVAARPIGMTNRMKEGVAEVLVRALKKTSKQPENVRESAVLALGLIGDADNDNVDKWIRYMVRKSVSRGGDMEKRFALIALAEIGGHKGQGDEPFAALPEIRGAIGKVMKSGKRDEKPWAALAAGVLGFELRAKGQDLDPALDTIIANGIRAGRKVSDLGAFSVAAGLRGSVDAQAKLVKKLGATRDEGACGYAAMGLGLIGDRDEAVESLQELFAESTGKPLLQTRTGLALGLLGDVGVVDQILERLESAEEEAEIVAAVTALGYLGDRRAVEAVSKLVVDEEGKASDAVREAAMVALGFIGDRSPKPWRTALTLGANYRARTLSLTTGEGDGVLDLK